MVSKEILICSHFRGIYSFPSSFAALGPKKEGGGGEEDKRVGETSSCSAPGPDHGFELLHKELGVPASGFVWGLTSQEGCWE